MNDLMIFEGHEVEVFDLDGKVLFNPYHVGECLELSDSAVRNYLAKMNEKQAIIIKNSDVRDKDIRKLNNAGEKFITESGVYKLAYKNNSQHKTNVLDCLAAPKMIQYICFYKCISSGILAVPVGAGAVFYLWVTMSARRVSLTNYIVSRSCVFSVILRRYFRYISTRQMMEFHCACV